MAFNASYGVLLFVLSLLSASLAFSPFFNYGTDKVRGVNLGGWLVLEPWITPSLFEGLDGNIVDELTFCQLQKLTTATDVLQNHWDTWITEADFKEISQTGLNHVRIPIGYWAFEKVATEPYIQGQALYLNKSITWAEKYGLKVIINLHGAPGSQNGFDNSGRRTGDLTWYSDPSNVDVTRAVLKQLISMYYNNPVVTAISVLNEPFPDKTRDPVQAANTLTAFYYDSYQIIRNPDGLSGSNTTIIYSDAFKGLEYWRDQQFMTHPREGAMMDIHKYQMFSYDEVGFTNDQHIAAACAQRTDLKKSDLWVIVGEWTPAATDCAHWLAL